MNTKEQFILFMTGFLIGKGICHNWQDAGHFAESLDLSFEEDYKMLPLEDWPKLAKQDAAEYLQSIKENGE